MWVVGDYQRINGGFHAFGDTVTSDCPAGWIDDGAGGCNRDPSYHGGGGESDDPTTPTGPPPSSGGGGGGGGGGGSSYPTSPPPSGPATAGMIGSTAPWLLGGAVLLGIIYFAATSKKHR